MKSRAGDGRKVEYELDTHSNRQARGIYESLMRQALGLLDATMRETWLPMGFRSLVVQEFPVMRRIIESRRANAFATLELHVAHLLEEAEPYKVFAKRSATLFALKELEAEIKMVRSAAAA